MKFPIGIQSFEQIIADGYVYVDKTDLVYSLATEGKVYFLSRPRRFGKSLLVSTLKNYFLGRKELFKGLKIDALEKEWKTYPVFHLDFNGQNFTKVDTLEKKISKFISGYESIYGGDQDMTLGDRFAALLHKVHEHTGLRCVVLIDEYDKPLLDVMETGLKTVVDGNEMSLEDYNREVLKGFYSTFKLADPDLQFVFLTGVTKFSQLSVFSGFNQPNDISMVPQYETICGVTDEEVDTCFRKPINEMAVMAGISYDEQRDILRRQYDGYHFSGRMKGVYNPFSLLSAMRNMMIDDYWFRTGTPSYLVRLLDGYGDRLNEFAGKYYAQSQFEDYRADTQQLLPMIYQSGYLTIKEYDSSMRTFKLDFPNDEVKNGFVTMVANSYLGGCEDTGSVVRNLIVSLKRRDLDAFRSCFDSFLASIPYDVRRKSNERERERDFTYTLYLIFRIASCYTTYIEKRQSSGRLDCAIVTDDSAFVFEFKLDGTATEAIAQINEMGYADEFLSPNRKVYKIGISISSETGRVADWMVEE